MPNILHESATHAEIDHQTAIKTAIIANMSYCVTMPSKALPHCHASRWIHAHDSLQGAKAESAPCGGLENLELANRSNMDLQVKGILPSRHTSLACASFHKLSGPHFVTPNHRNTIVSKTQLQATPAR